MQPRNMDDYLAKRMDFSYEVFSHWLKEYRVHKVISLREAIASPSYNKMAIRNMAKLEIGERVQYSMGFSVKRIA